MRYFNADTGYGGKSYAQQTSKRIYEEMKDPKMVKAWVEEYGLGPACVFDNGLLAWSAECDERELKYIEKCESKSAAERSKQLDRLGSMKGKKMSPDAATWISKRIAILKQFLETDAKEL